MLTRVFKRIKRYGDSTNYLHTNVSAIFVTVSHSVLRVSS